jgi:methyl-accepting chemotaxis protein
MSAIEETIAAIQALIQQLQQSASTAGNAAKSAEQGRGLATSVGAQTSIQQFTQLQDGLNQVQGQIGALTERVRQLLTQAKVIHGG